MSGVFYVTGTECTVNEAALFPFLIIVCDEWCIVISPHSFALSMNELVEAFILMTTPEKFAFCF